MSQVRVYMCVYVCICATSSCVVSCGWPLHVLPLPYVMPVCCS